MGHSDADVVLHAVADALLGAAALGDIGEHFPDTDPQWKGLDGSQLLAGVVELVAREAGSVGNLRRGRSTPRSPNSPLIKPAIRATDRPVCSRS